jgi:hypothetical protein
MLPNIKLWLKDFLKTTPVHFKWRLTAFVSLCAITIVMMVTTIWSNQHDFKISTFTRWEVAFQESQQTNEYFQQRTPASASEQFSCLNQKNDTVSLKQEVMQLEMSYDSGKPVEGNWRGINLATLPTPQAQLILDHGQYIANNDKDFSHCRDITCVFNDIYQSQQIDLSAEKSYLSYYWYLKTGSFISLIDQHFSHEELVNLWKLSQSLPESFFFLPSFKVIRKMVIDDGSKCSELKSSGELHIQPNCLNLVSQDRNQLIQYATIFLNVIDENKLIQKEAISKSSDWLSLSEWKKQEHINDQLVYSYKWNHTPSDELFISDFSKLSPLDHLVSSVAHFRYNPDGFFLLGQSLTSFIAKSFFENNYFDGKGLHEKYLKFANKTWDELESGFWVECLNNHYDVDFIAKSKGQSQFQKLNSQLYACMENKIPSFVAKVLGHIKAQESEGCDFLNNEQYKSYSAQFHESLTKSISKRIFKTHFDLEKWGVEVLIGYKIKNTVADELDPTADYVSCTTRKDLEQCYENRLSIHVDSMLKKHGKIHPSFSNQLKHEITERFQFKKIMVEAESKIKRFLFPYYSQLRQVSQATWKECLSKTSSSLSISSYSPFDGGEYFVQPHILNCVNSKIHPMVGKILNTPVVVQFDKKRQVAFDLKSGEKHYAHQHLVRRATQYFNEFTANESEKEHKSLREFFSSNSENMIYKVVGDEYFLKNIFSQAQVKERCLEIISKYYPENTNFHNKSILQGNYGNSICHEVLKNGKVQRAVASTIEHEWSNVRQTMLKDFRVGYQQAIDDCYDRYPTKLSIDLVKNSQLRQKCLESEHQELSEKLLGNFRSSMQAEYFSSKEEELRSAILNIKQEIIQKMKSTESLIR